MNDAAPSLDHLAVPLDALCTRCDAARLPFESTAELDDLHEVIGQERAIEALEFAASIDHDGYNIYALGPSGIGRHLLVRRVLERACAQRPVPDDWCYVYDFDHPEAPSVIRLPAGRGVPLRDEVDLLVTDLRAALASAFTSEDYGTRRQALQDAYEAERDATFEAFVGLAEEKGFAVLRTPHGITIAPAREDKVLNPEQIDALPDEEKAQIEADLPEITERLQAILREAPLQEAALQERVRELNREVTSDVAHLLVAALAKRWDVEAVQAWLGALEQDVIQHAARFVSRSDEGPQALLALEGGPDAWFRRYTVNVLVDNGALEGAPLVREDNPRLPNLIGRIEHRAQFGTLVTDFTLLRAGALHRANGGVLILDAEKLLSQPLSWQHLKRALRSREITLESLGEALGLVSTNTLEPDPIPLKVKVVLVGSRELYYALSALDPEFPLLFKVPADFEHRVPRDGDADLRYARLIATLGRQDGLLPFDRSGVAAVIAQAARLAGDSERLTVHMDSLTDLLRESDHGARRAEREAVTEADVEAAITAAERRAGRMHDRELEAIAHGTIRIQTSGEEIGQLNGLSTVMPGAVAFGRPSRISAQVRMGQGGVLDIERQVELGGPIHSKGVLILTGFLGSRYAADKPLAFAATLVFEQSYGGVEGDSASLAETCALLSALGGLPLKQGVAVTGSIDQKGRVQAVGAVNEKIEGFFDVCAGFGLDGSQGVIIPKSNVRNLMLRDPVVDAVRDGKFNVWAVEHVDEAMELLCGLPAGKRGKDDEYPENTINARVEDRIDLFAVSAAGFGAAVQAAFGEAVIAESEG